MKRKKMVALLYEKDTDTTYANLLEIEEISQKEDIFYPFLNEFISMLSNNKQGIRTRGYRLVCKQAKWDNDNIINDNIVTILDFLNQEKPTVVRQAIQYLKYIIPYKPELKTKVKDALLMIETTRFKETVRPLVEKDIKEIINLLEYFF